MWGGSQKGRVGVQASGGGVCGWGGGGGCGGWDGEGAGGR